MSVVADIADAVRDALNEAPAATFSKEFRAKRKWLPRVELAKMGATLYVSVVPTTDERTTSSRRGIARDIPIDIGIQKKLTTGIDPDAEAANPEIDELVGFVEELADYLKPGMRLAGHVIVRTAVDPVCDRDQLAQNSVFQSVVNVAFKIP